MRPVSHHLRFDRDLHAWSLRVTAGDEFLAWDGSPRSIRREAAAEFRRRRLDFSGVSESLSQAQAVDDLEQRQLVDELWSVRNG